MRWWMRLWHADDKRTEIRLKNDGGGRLRLRIRVGPFGDAAQSLAILVRIKANL
jgi:hypothetical protein